MADTEIGGPRSRVEGYLDNALGASHAMGKPKSRVEALLAALVDAIRGGGGKTIVAGDNVQVTEVDGTVTISATDTTYQGATASAAGLMSAAHWSKLDGMPPVEVVGELPASPVAGTVYVVAEEA